MSHIIKGVGFLCLIFVFSTKGFSTEPDSLYAMGLRAIWEGDYELAIDYIDQANMEKPNPEYYVRLAYCYNQLRVFEGQRDIIQEGLKVFPEESRLYHARGEYYRSTKDMFSSVQDFTKAMDYAENDTSRAFYQVERAWSKYYMQDFDGAKEDCEEVYAFDSTHIGGLNGLAMVYERMGDSEKAIWYLKKMHEQDPEEATVLVNIGFTYQNIGEYEKSLIYLDSAVVMNPRDAYAINNRSYTKLKLGDLKGALKDVNASLEMHNSNCYAYRNKGLIYLEMGKKKKACEAFQKAINFGFTQKYGLEVRNLQRKHCI